MNGELVTFEWVGGPYDGELMTLRTHRPDRVVVLVPRFPRPDVDGMTQADASLLGYAEMDVREIHVAIERRSDGRRVARWPYRLIAQEAA